MNRAAATGRLAGMLIGVSAALFLAACDRATHEPGPRATPSIDPTAQRIVCMSPAMTQMIVDLGRGDRIVGVGSFDFAAPPHAAVVGHLRGLDYEKLIAARPTDVVLQITREGVPDRLAEMAAASGWRIWRWRLEDRASVIRTLHDPDASGDTGLAAGGGGDSIGGMLGEVDAARSLAESIARRLDAIAKATAGRRRPRVLVAVDTDPVVRAAGPGTYIDQLLTVAGGVNALTDAAVLYPELDAERLLSIAPDVVMVITSGDRATPGKVPAGLAAKVVTLTDRRALLPSSTMPTVAAKMARLLHPDIADAIDEAMGEAEDAKQENRKTGKQEIRSTGPAARSSFPAFLLSCFPAFAVAGSAPT